MSDLDTLARAAAHELLERSAPDLPARYAELKRIRARRTTAKLVAAAAVVAFAAGGWQLASSREGDVEPAPSPARIDHGVLIGRPADVNRSAPWVAVDGGDLAHLPGDALPLSRPQFTADGNELVYVDSSQTLVSLDVRTGERRTLESCAKWGCLGSMSPDGTNMAWSIRRGFRLAPLDSPSGERLVETPPTWHGPAAWSPDGTRLGYSANDGVHVIDLASGRDELVYTYADETTLMMGVSWAPDGSALAFFDMQSVPGPGYEETRFTATTLELGNGATHALVDAGRCVCLGAAPPSLTWSPDGSVVAVSTIKGGAATGVTYFTPDGEEIGSRGFRSYEELVWQPLAD